MKYDYPPELKPIETEKELLSAVVWDDHIRGEVFDTVNVYDLSSKTCRRMFEVLLAMYHRSTPIDLATFIDEYTAKHKDLKKYDMVDILTEHPHHHSEIAMKRVLLMSQRRRVWRFAQNVMDTSMTEPIESLNEKVIERALKLGFNDNRKAIVGTEELALNYLDTMEKRKNEELFRTGIPVVDKHINGFRRQQYILLAGRPSQGKTSLALNMMRHMSQRHVPVGIISLETERYTIFSWLLAIHTGVSIRSIQNMSVKKKEMESLEGGIEYLSKQRIVIADNFGCTISQLRNEVRRMKQIHPSLALIVIDHVQLMSGDKRQGRNQELGEISRGMKSMLREFNIAGLVLSQLNRGVESDGRTIPELRDLRESGDLEQDADIIMCFHARDVNLNTRKIRVLKNKEGAANVDFELRFNGKCLRFEGDK